MKDMLKIIFKPVRDLFSILYDDLEFKVMSLPRVGAAALTALIAALVIDWLKTGRECPYFAALCGLGGGLWGTYLLKRRGNPPEEFYGQKGDERYAGNDKNEIKRGDNKNG